MVPVVLVPVQTNYEMHVTGEVWKAPISHCVWLPAVSAHDELQRLLAKHAAATKLIPASQQQTVPVGDFVSTMQCGLVLLSSSSTLSTPRVRSMY